MLLDRIVTKCVLQRHVVPGFRTVIVTSSPSTGSSSCGGSRLTWMKYHLNQRYKSSISADTTSSSSRVTHVSSSTRNETTTTTTTTSTYMTGIVTALLAATAGVVTVSSVANMVERHTATKVPKFDVQQQQQRFDTTTYMGRFYHMLLQCDPYLLLYSNQQVMDAKHFVDTYVSKQLHLQQQQRMEGRDQSDYSAQLDHSDVYNNNDTPKSTDSEDEYDIALHRQLWEAKRIYESAMNDSGAIIPRPFRMSGYVPYNGPICVMMISSTSTVSILLWSWINQSQNAFVNYYNRSNSSQPINMYTFLQSYTIAVSSALCVAFGLATFIQKRYSPQKAQLLMRYVAFPSAVVASSLNCYIVRSPEIATGIPLCDEDGNNVMDVAAITTTANHDNHDNHDETVLESHDDTIQKSSTTNDETITRTSQIAATRGVYATTASRALLQAPVYFLPPLLMSLCCSKKLLSSPTKMLPITTYLLLCSFGFGLPAACAIFPQTSSIPAKEVEVHFQSLIDPKTQQPYKIFYYDKGL